MRETKLLIGRAAELREKSQELELIIEIPRNGNEEKLKVMTAELVKAAKLEKTVEILVKEMDSTKKYYEKDERARRRKRRKN